MIRECKCPKCKQMIDTVYCNNCGEEIEVYQIKNLLTNEEQTLLDDILGHVNYDAEEAETMSSLRKKLER